MRAASVPGFSGSLLNDYEHKNQNNLGSRARGPLLMLQHSNRSTSILHGSKTYVHDLPYSNAAQFLVEIINFFAYKLISAEPVETVPHTLYHILHGNGRRYAWISTV